MSASNPGRVTMTLYNPTAEYLIPRTCRKLLFFSAVAKNLITPAKASSLRRPRTLTFWSG